MRRAALLLLAIDTGLPSLAPVLFEMLRDTGKDQESPNSIDWLLENQDKVEHYFHQQGLEGNL